MARLWVPIILINFKTYLEAVGQRAVTLAKYAAETTRETGVCVAIAPQTPDIGRITQDLDVPIFAQHIDPYPPGSYTGYVLPETVRDAGAIGTLLNHSEHRLRMDELEASINRAQEASLTTCVCSNVPTVGAAVAHFNPSMIAIEPPELIGTGKAVSKSKPEAVTEAVTLIKQVNGKLPVLCGAGIVDGSDVEAALNLGAIGVLVSSSVVKSKDPRTLIFDLANAATKYLH
jgi:triosephosphate isomerase (TIM)